MKKMLVGLCLAALVLSPGALSAQIDVGGHLSWADDADFGVGARGAVVIPLKAASLLATGSFDWFFPSTDIVDFNYYEFNTNLAYMIPLQNSPVEPYVGGGLNLAIISMDEITETILGQTIVVGGGTATELGLNLVGGAMFNVAPRISPYGELRVEIGGGEQFVFTGGVAFNVGPGFAPKK